MMEGVGKEEGSGNTGSLLLHKERERAINVPNLLLLRSRSQ